MTCQHCGSRAQGTLCAECKTLARLDEGASAGTLDVDTGVEHTCAVCRNPAPEGDYERPGVWMCPGCAILGLQRPEREQLTTVTEDLLSGQATDPLVSAIAAWAVAAGGAYPRSWMTGTTGFQTGSEHARADGGHRIVELPSGSIDLGPKSGQEDRR